MSAWQWALLTLLPTLTIALFCSARGSVSDRLVALQLTSTLCTILLATATFAFDQASSIDLALALGFLTLPGGLVFALFAERYL